ncbi:hypothetical protein SAMN05660236_4572 [Ohtaekwangia koreensis]|uniref:Uncharacterized protein n=1 Tax=Ohtaekwangia koreensis TaxID=688867 RepID=A0A1T5M7N5_9BACT|nr:hypothetical protein SAMN05660236_4572 [Ohtaekwangia koreensis]
MLANRYNDSLYIREQWLSDIEGRRRCFTEYAFTGELGMGLHVSAINGIGYKN